MPADPYFLSTDVIWAYTKSFNGGMMNLQNFGANLLLQTLTGNYSAAIVQDIGPIQIKYPDEDKPYNNAIPVVFSYVYYFSMIPFFLYFSHTIVTEKESGVRARILSHGMSSAVYFLSWQLATTIVNFFISLAICVPLYISVMS